MFIDSHCHLHLIDYQVLGVDLPQVLKNASIAKVERFLSVSTHLDDASALYDLSSSYSNIDISIGLHPNETVDEEPMFEELLQKANHPRVVAIGETGLDYFRSEKSTLQHERFLRHIEVSKQLNKPLIIHSREAAVETLSVLKSEAGNVTGVFHCFTYDSDIAKKVLDLGFYISFSGIVTFQNAKSLQSVAKEISLNSMLIETDCPYLAPTPYRGKINQPAYVKEVAEYIAKLRGTLVEEIAEYTTRNYHRLFSTEKSK